MNGRAQALAWQPLRLMFESGTMSSEYRCNLHCQQPY
jgi:hypothetical protein